MVDAIEFRKQYKRYYSPKKEPEIIMMPQMKYAMVSGRGNPETSEAFHHAIQALYGILYTIKFSRRKVQQKPDFTMGPLEGLWWTSGGNHFDARHKARWQWMLMMWVPHFITQDDIDAAADQVHRKKPNPLLHRVKVGLLDEGKVVQIMHVGPYATVAEDIEKMHEYAVEHDYKIYGKHHEIYMNDPRRTKPENVATILRQPII